MTNASFLEPSEKLDPFFPASLHKANVHIFKNISKCFIHGLRQFKYNNICELWELITDKYKKGSLMVSKCFVLHKEVIDCFHEILYITTIENL